MQMDDDMEDNGENEFRKMTFMSDENTIEDDFEQEKFYSGNGMLDENSDSKDNDNLIMVARSNNCEFNDYNKRSRPIFFGDEEIKIMNDEETRQELDKLEPYTTPIMIIPGYRKPPDHTPQNYANNTGPIIPDEDTQKKWKEWKYEQNKEEIRQLIKLNKNNKNKAKEAQQKIEEMGFNQYEHNMFFSGTKSKRKDQKLW